jgi:hypothetical protein
LENRGDWANLNAVGRVERSREIDGKVSIERSEFLCSFRAYPVDTPKSR